MFSQLLMIFGARGGRLMDAHGVQNDFVGVFYSLLSSLALENCLKEVKRADGKRNSKDRRI